MIATLTALLLTAQASSQPSVDLRDAGTATRSMFFTDIYEVTVSDPDGRLTEADLNDESVPRKVTLNVLYDGSVPDIPEGWSEELEPALSEQRMSTVRSAYKDLEQGDTVVLAYEPGYGSVLRVNGDPVASGGYELTAAFMDIWFGDTPVSEDIKSEIMASGD